MNDKINFLPSTDINKSNDNYSLDLRFSFKHKFICPNVIWGFKSIYLGIYIYIFNKSM